MKYGQSQIYRDSDFADYVNAQLEDLRYPALFETIHNLCIVQVFDMSAYAMIYG